MSHTLLTKAPALRTLTRRSITQTYNTAPYHTRPSSPKMPTGTHHLRTLIRQTTLRASTTTLQRTSYPVSQHFHTQQSPARTRSPSPPPRYEARNTTLLAPTSQWTHFSTPYTLSSIRTFTSTPKIQWPATPTSTPSSPPLSPDAQARVTTLMDTITDLYGTAKDEFEIASEESEKNSTYAADDRAAARKELDKLVQYFEDAGQEGDGVGEEVRRRVGGRVRELVGAVGALEERSLHGE
ncbi:hypothetical protein CC86DRAFT_153610 [Ophiobolus disseminans]|uniref:Uncharacterized protein n=1 Tax=Ophiobolus disseminans TaxID=1469910 RepID=A0A6A6ZDG7_9PLEO|nr:hypothetical protein CC86DRAFT_153610 [Ophiobolus disseminans]